MNYFVAKTEPSEYSIDSLKAEHTTTWEGVRNPQAVKALLSMKKGDRVFIYHSGGVSAITGLAEVVDDATPDPKDAKAALVRFRYLAHIDPPVTLKEIKEDGRFADWALVRQGRLSTMGSPAAFVDWIRKTHPKAKI